MPQAVAAIAAAATWVGAEAGGFAASVTGSLAVGGAVSNIAFAATEVGIYAGFSAGLVALTAPRLPDPAALQTPLKQPMPPRQSAFGRVRVGGAYALFTVGAGSDKHVSYDVLALLDGKSQQVVGFYLNDDLMAKTSSGNYWWAPGAPGKYGGGGSAEPNLVQIDYRVGLATETAYAISSTVPVWDSSHRGDGVTSMLLRCKEAKREDQPGDFPNGLPVPSAVIDAQLIFDPRDTGQTYGTASTYKFSDNAPLCLLAYLTDASGGMGLDYARFLAPTIDYLKAAADEADGIVSTSGMHATLLDAAAAGDNKIFLADTTGLAAGVDIDLPTETVTVSSVGLAGEVDLTGTLTYAHSAGELAYWDATGQSARYRCAGTYRHDTAPGDVIKSITSTFDGWMQPRGDGAIVIRTNTLYAPSVVLTDRHIVGYRVQHFLPDEQATNQYIVSYTDPASAFNKAEAGYVQDDIDIAARGQVRSQSLDLAWVPSSPQAIAVGRAMLARATQPLRGTLTCNLAGLAVMGERYVRVQVSELPDLNNLIVEVTGKVSIDLSTMTVSFPWVALGGVGAANSAICIAIDVSLDVSDASIVSVQGAVASALTGVSEAIAAGAKIDLCAVAVGHSDHTTPNIARYGAAASDVDDVVAWVNALTQIGASGFTPVDAMTAAATFFSGCDAGTTDRRLIIIAPGDINPLSPSGQAAAAGSALAAMSPAVQSYVIVTRSAASPAFAGMADYSALYDNTPSDGVFQGYVPPGTSGSSSPDPAQQAILTQGLVAAIEGGIYGSSSSAGSSYTLPTLSPPSGAALEPLTAPTITSVTPGYPNSGGGVQGARLSIVVGEPGGSPTWKVQWKLHADTVWTSAGVDLPASGTPLTIVTGLIAAAGSIDVQVAYVTAAQTSPWSATTTVTVSAPAAVVTDAATATEALSAGQVCNLYTASGAAKVQKANATDLTKPANCFVLAAVASGASATVLLPGQWITGLSGLTPGATYYLSTTGGGLTATCPSAAGNGAQVVGTADSTGTKLFFAPGPMTGV